MVPALHQEIHRWGEMLAPGRAQAAYSMVLLPIACMAQFTSHHRRRRFSACAGQPQRIAATRLGLALV